MVRRWLTVVLALATASALALPGLASAQRRSAPPATSHTGGAGGTQLGVLVGFEDGSGDTGLALRLDGEWYWQALSPQVRLSFVGSVGFSHWSFNAGFFQAPSSTLNIFKLTPAVRFSFGNSPVIRPYADVGIGLHYASFTFKERDIFGNVFSVSDSDVSVHMRFAGGLLFHVSPGLSLGGEIDFTPYFGDVDDNTFSLLFVAQFRM
ncbi:MAG TPA: outer membrane beta-barrel protein [Anaeromyxobacter sp.]